MIICILRVIRRPSSVVRRPSFVVCRRPSPSAVVRRRSSPVVVRRRYCLRVSVNIYLFIYLSPSLYEDPFAETVRRSVREFLCTSSQLKFLPFFFSFFLLEGPSLQVLRRHKTHVSLNRTFHIFYLYTRGLQH